MNELHPRKRCFLPEEYLRFHQTIIIMHRTERV